MHKMINEKEARRLSKVNAASLCIEGIVLCGVLLSAGCGMSDSNVKERVNGIDVPEKNINNEFVSLSSHKPRFQGIDLR